MTNAPLYSVAQDIFPNDTVVVDDEAFIVFDTLRTPDGRVTFLLDSLDGSRGTRMSFAPMDLVAVLDPIDE